MNVDFKTGEKPTFLVAGAAKSGTTSVYHSLRSHPEVFVTNHKEPYFFSFLGEKPNFEGPYDQDVNNNEIIYDINEYVKLYEKSEGFLARGECSTSYIYLPGSAENIASVIPDCRLVVILRDPVKRAYSHYLQAVMLGHEHLSFEDAIKEAPERKNKNWRWHYQYLDQSNYYTQLQRFYKVFDAEQIKVVVFEDLISSYQAEMSAIYSHIGVTGDFATSQTQENRTGMPRNHFIHQLLRYPGVVKDLTRSIMPSSWRANLFQLLESRNYDAQKNPHLEKCLHESLNTQFEGEVAQLSDLLGREFPHWLKPPLAK